MNDVPPALPGNLEIAAITARRRRSAVIGHENINPKSLVFLTGNVVIEVRYGEGNARIKLAAAQRHQCIRVPAWPERGTFIPCGGAVNLDVPLFENGGKFT